VTEPNQIGTRLRELRRRAGLTQGELAARAGCGRASVSRWELGTEVPRPAHVRALAGALGVEPAALGQAPGTPLRGKRAEVNRLLREAFATDPDVLGMHARKKGKPEK
jgi:transcriptional regulator with XRE-family HTH domain